LTLKIEEVSFDNNIIASKVGQITLQNANDFNLQTALDTQHDVVYIKSAEPITSLKKYFTGELQQYSCSFDNYYEHLKQFESKFKYSIDSLQSSQLSELESLLNYMSPTRFSSDSRISSTSNRKHKLKLLQYYFNATPNLSLIYNKENIQALHSAFYKDSNLHLYEIIICPELRTGFLALQLLYESANRAKNHNKNIDTVKTSIYSDNKSSIALFKNLGLKYINSTYYYHVWNS
jgi:hypothetical protein